MIKYFLYIFFAISFVGILYFSTNKTPKRHFANLQTKIKDIKVGFVYFGYKYDQGWNQSHDDARLLLESKDSVKTYIKENIKTTEQFFNCVSQLQNKGCNIIVATSYNYIEYIDKIVSFFPEIKFLHCSGYKTEINLSNYFGKMYEARYLAGVLAALRCQNNKIGYIASFAIPEVVRGINAFTLGAKQINPNIEVYLYWTRSWSDKAEEKLQFNRAIKDNCNIITYHQDTSYLAFLCKKNKINFIAYHQDLESLFSKYKLASLVWNWYPYYQKQILNYSLGSWRPSSFWKGLKGNIVNLTSVNSVLSKDIKSEIKKYYNKIITKDLIIFKGPIIDNKGVIRVYSKKSLSDNELLTMKWLVKGVIEK